jgi:hypothetical protein
MSQQNLDLIGTHDIAHMLGVTQSHCVGRIIKRPDFPKPAINLSQRLRKWKRDDVLRFLGVK